MNWHESGLTVGQLAKRMEISPSAVRWYDDHGLLPSERTADNHRRFFADACCRVAMIRAAQRVGLSIADIRQAFEALPPRQAPTQHDWNLLAEQLRTALDARVDELFRLMEELAPATATED
ncbi:MerR family transcriptional regulator [Propionibacteriaceae bacterium Y1685]|uniref:MerR family transcriptional regulator n=1 Tax=Microlunatus sp. Y1700 TaxID=3418487 RepID=UPI003B7FD6FF